MARWSSIEVFERAFDGGPTHWKTLKILGGPTSSGILRQAQNHCGQICSIFKAWRCVRQEIFLRDHIIYRWPYSRGRVESIEIPKLYNRQMHGRGLLASPNPSFVTFLLAGQSPPIYPQT
jgi:hypothetical protein